MLIYLLIIFSIYFVFVIVCIRGWVRFSSQVNNKLAEKHEFASVIIAMRNEEQVVTPLLKSLLAQDYPRDKFEVIIVDDHSTDRTFSVLHDWIKNNPILSCRILKSAGVGKKRALTEGIKQASGEIILTTDADCTLPENWISRTTDLFTPSTSMVIGLVTITSGKSMFSKIQALEFNSLIGSSMAWHALGYPIMCNAASLAFRKSKFEAVNGYEDNLQIPSGDDEFLMRKLNQAFPGSIKSMPRPPLVVETQPQPSLKHFIYQRLRWAGKWKANDSITVKIIALFILVFQASSLLSLYLLLTGDHLITVATLLIFKMTLEFVYLITVGKYVGQPFSMPAFILLQVVYPFYVLFIGVLSQVLDYEWKGRHEKASG
jgi:poly-beta-1,6-N-acetyl-D-glucosamine synthase